MLVAMLAGTVMAFGNDDESLGSGPFPGVAEPQDVQTVRGALDKYGATLEEAIPGFTGAAIGNAPGPSPNSADDDAFLIDVFVEEEAQVPPGPQAVGGVSLRFRAFGPIGKSPSDLEELQDSR